jgi:alkanesulfonate monooxygenase SsuD/methylene tetrahydromethanopterin reductase-like flavin-dependent oxidoreductase (luciferase family)
MSEKIATYGTDAVIDYFMNLQVWGTPDQCYERILDIHSRTGNSHYVGVFSYAGMPYDEAERNLRLFAAEVMPALKKLDTGVATTGAATERRVGEQRNLTALGF